MDGDLESDKEVFFTKEVIDLEKHHDYRKLLSGSTTSVYDLHSDDEHEKMAGTISSVPLQVSDQAMPNVTRNSEIFRLL